MRYRASIRSRRPGMWLCWLLLALVIASPACRKKLPEEREIKDVIKKFDKALIEVYRTIKPEPLIGVASETEISRNDSMLTDYVKKNKYMESEVHNMKIEEIKKVEGGAVEAVVLELWHWRDIDAATGKEIKPWADEEFRISYKIIRDKKLGWIVDKAKIISRRRLNS